MLYRRPGTAMHVGLIVQDDKNIPIAIRRKVVARQCTDMIYHARLGVYAP